MKIKTERGQHTKRLKLQAGKGVVSEGGGGGGIFHRQTSMITISSNRSASARVGNHAAASAWAFFSAELVVATAIVVIVATGAIVRAHGTPSFSTVKRVTLEFFNELRKHLIYNLLVFMVRL